MISMNRPSRGDRESATTTRYAGRLDEPALLSRIDTDTSSPPGEGKPWHALHAAQPSLHPLELLHHLPELRILLQEPVHVLHAGAAAPRDALAAATVDDVRMAPLPRRHGRDDGVEAPDVRGFLVELLRGGALHELAETGDHPEDLVERPHLLDLAELVAEILQGEAVLAELLDQGLGLLAIDRLLGLLDQREHVAHAEDARGHAVGMEGLQGVDLLAHAHERDGPAGDMARRQRGAAA